jgi:hypothetical protein
MLASYRKKLLTDSWFGLLFDGYSFPVSVTNSANHFIYLNPAFEKFYHYSAKQLLGLSPSVLGHGTVSVAQAKEIRRSLIGMKGHWEGVLNNRMASGKSVRIFLLALALKPMGPELPSAFVGLSCLERDHLKLISSLLGHVALLALHNETTRVELSPRPLTNARGSRRNEIIRLTHFGYTSKEVAQLMNISPSTVANVKWKTRQLYEKA